MSNNGITNSGITRFLVNQVRDSKPPRPAGGANPQVDFATYLAQFRGQAVALLTGSDTEQTATTGVLSATSASPADMLSLLQRAEGVHGVVAPGRNAALTDPESAYTMMSVINDAEVRYKAQFDELSQMKAAVAQLGQLAEGFAGVDVTAGAADLKTRLQTFVDEYNRWVQRFGADVQEGGLLANVQAADVALHGLAHTLTDRFYGAADGVHGLRNLGLTLDPDTGLAALDAATLDRMLATNPDGVGNALQAFGKRLDQVVDRLTADHNFLANRIDNLARAIQYLDENKADLTAEFGTGEAAQPTGALADAVARYDRTHGKQG